jgi:acyl carrier protein
MRQGQDISDTVRRFIVEQLFPLQGRSDVGFSDEASLFRSGILDSFGLLKLLNYVEATFGIVIDDEDVAPEHFGSLDAIAGYVTSKRAMRGREPGD